MSKRKTAISLGELTYEGSPCKHCSGTVRYSRNAHCRVCHSKSDRDKYGPRRAEQDARRRLKMYCPMAQMDSEAIVDMYREAAFLTATTGVPHQVDHVIPLHHPLICGLHVSWNMDILTAEENVRKSNSFDPTGPRVHLRFCAETETQILNRFTEYDDQPMAGS